MKVLRTSIWTNPAVPPLTFVMRESDMALSIEEYMEMQPPGQFIARQVFDMDDGEIFDATLEAHKRQAEVIEDEHSMAIMYDYEAKMFAKVSDGGVMMATLPSPLSVEQVTDVLRQLEAREDYRGFTISMITKDMRVVSLKDGKILVATVE